MLYFGLPIYRDALALVVYLETIVHGFEKYHKYTIGKDLRKKSKKLLFLIHQANNDENQIKYLKKLLNKCEEMKMLIAIAKELKAFKSFNQFEHSTQLCVPICKQAQAWYNHFARVDK